MIDSSEIYSDLRSNLERIAAEKPGWSVGDYHGIPYLISPPISVEKIAANAVTGKSIVTNSPQR